MTKHPLSPHWWRTALPGLALLPLPLAMVQVVCRPLPADGTPWWVSGGVMAGYGSRLPEPLCRQWKVAKA